jgi:hypothetical protein
MTNLDRDHELVVLDAVIHGGGLCFASSEAGITLWDLLAHARASELFRELLKIAQAERRFFYEFVGDEPCARESEPELCPDCREKLDHAEDN